MHPVTGGRDQGKGCMCQGKKPKTSVSGSKHQLIEAGEEGKLFCNPRIYQIS
jgi:hypothetical protein